MLTYLPSETSSSKNSFKQLNPLKKNLKIARKDHDNKIL